MSSSAPAKHRRKTKNKTRHWENGEDDQLNTAQTGLRDPITLSLNSCMLYIGSSSVRGISRSSTCFWMASSENSSLISSTTPQTLAAPFVKYYRYHEER